MSIENPKTYAVVNEENIVVNIILWDSDDEWTPPRGCRAIEYTDNVYIGQTLTEES